MNLHGLPLFSRRRRRRRLSLNTSKGLIWDLRSSRRWLWRMPFSGMWHRAVFVWTDVSEDHIASISRVEESANEELAWTGLLAHAGSSLADSSTMEMEAIRSSETSVHTKTARCHIPENGILQSKLFPVIRKARYSGNQSIKPHFFQKKPA
jgi:hypothetical protein